MFEGLRLENFEIFYGHLEYFTDIWDILWAFGTFCVHLVHFSGFGIMHQNNLANPDVHRRTVPGISNYHMEYIFISLWKSLH
jgi:hypothetical protein